MNRCHTSGASIFALSGGACALWRDSRVVELRAKGTSKGVQSGYFDDPHALARAAFELHKQGAPGIYVTINPVDPVLLARGPNLLRAYAKETTKDVDILKRCWLPIDLDSRRKSGISATNEEHEAAIVRATSLATYLCQLRGWPQPLFVDSGNGANLFFPIDLPNDETSKTLVRSVLDVLARRFDDEAVLIDQGVYNAARLMKLPGTMARKGADMPDRPHRCSEILGGVDERTPSAMVRAAQLQALVAEEHYFPSATGQAAHVDFDDEHFLARITVKRGPGPYQVFGGVAQRWIVQCPFVPDHGGTTAAVIRMPGGAIVFKCLGDRCRDRTWADVRALFEPVERREGRRSQWNSAAAATGFRSWRELLQEPEVSTDWLVEGMLPRGGSSLWVAKPKVGKSTSMQNLAHAVSCRHDFLGRAVVSGPVLYLALEEKESEVRKHFEAMGTPEDAPLYFYFARTPDDALSWLRTAIEQYQPTLVIVDTFQKFTRVRDIKDYAIVTNKMDPIMALARESGAHVAFTHHGTKAHCADPGDAALGSTALFGGVDTLVYLRKTQNYRTIGSIQRYGEDLSETILTLDSATWTVSLGGLRKADDRRAAAQAILDFLGEIAEPLDEPTIREQVGGRTQDLAPALRDLVKEGSIVRSGGGRKGDPYRYASSTGRRDGSSA